MLGGYIWVKLENVKGREGREVGNQVVWLLIQPLRNFRVCVQGPWR